MEKQHIYQSLCLSNSSQQPSLLASGQWSLCVQVCFQSKRSMTALLWPNRMQGRAGVSARCLNCFGSCGCLCCCKWQSTCNWGASFLLRVDSKKKKKKATEGKFRPLLEIRDKAPISFDKTRTSAIVLWQMDMCLHSCLRQGRCEIEMPLASAAKKIGSPAYPLALESLRHKDRVSRQWVAWLASTNVSFCMYKGLFVQAKTTCRMMSTWPWQQGLQNEEIISKPIPSLIKKMRAMFWVSCNLALECKKSLALGNQEAH